MKLRELGKRWLCGSLSDRSRSTIKLASTSERTMRPRSVAKFVKALQPFNADERGNVALLFGLTVVMIFVAVGAGLDLARAYQTRQKLAEVAMLACQYATRPTIIAPVAASNSGTLQQQDYVAAVTSYINTSLGAQKLAVMQTSSAPFTYTPGGNSQVTLTATMPTVFMQIANVNTIPLKATANCFTTVAQVTTSTSPILCRRASRPPPFPQIWTGTFPAGLYTRIQMAW